MSRDAINNQYVGPKELQEEVFLDNHGRDQTKSFSAAVENRAGTKYYQHPAGQIFGKFKPENVHYPLAYDAADGAVSSGNDIKVESARQFRVGDWVELPTSVAADATRFRQVTAVDKDTETITLGGAAFSLADGDNIEVDPTRSFGQVPTGGGATAPGSSPTTIQLGTGEAANFEVGDEVEVGDDGNGPYTVEAVDTANDTIDIDANIATSDDDVVVSDKDGEYKISVKTADAQSLSSEMSVEYSQQNLLVPHRPHGEVRESTLVGLTPDAKAAMQPLITFSDAS